MNWTDQLDHKVLPLVREHAIGETDGELHGATFDGRRLVLASGNRLLRLLPDNGRVVDQLETFPDRGGVAYDGRHLWQQSEGRIQELDPRTGFVLRSISPGLHEITGLERVDDDLLVLHSGGRALARVDTLARAETLDAVAVAQAEFDVPLHGLARIAQEFWSFAEGELYCIDLVSARIMPQFALPKDIEVCDLAGDAKGRVWCVDGRSRVIRAFARPA
jgi:hypothetical protein